jgi:iterative type I PKS product template protein
MSTVFGRMLERSDLTDEYPFRHARQPVLFERSIQELRQMGMLDSALCLEIGPHPITLPAIRGSFSDEAVTCIPTLQKSRPAWVALSSSLGQISLIRDDILWRELFHSTSARFIDLPKYLLQGTPFKVAYQEPSQTPLPEPELSSCDSAYPLLAGPLNVSDDISEFKTSMRLLGPLISGHNVGGSPICPASVYHELVLEAVASLQVSTEGKVLEVKDMVFSQPLVLGAIGESEAILVRTVKRDRGAAFEFSIYCQEPADKYRSVYCTGMVMARPSAELGNRWLKDAVIVQRQTAYMDKSSIPLNSFNTKVLYESVFTRVVRYSSDYHTLQELRVSDSSLEGIGTFLLPPDANRGRYVVPPVFTDTLLHTAGFIANLIIGSEEICICSHVQSIDILRSDEMDCSQRFTIYCSLVDVIKGLIVADVVVLEEQGRVVAKATGLEFKKLRLSSFLAMLNRSKPETATKVVERAGATLVEAETPNASSMSLHRNRQTSLKEPNQKRLSVRETLLKVISSVSGLEESDLLDQYLSLETLGIDSMMHIELADKLRKAFPGVNLSHEEFSQNETIHALEQALASLLGRDSGDSTSSTPFPRGTPSSTGTPSSSTSVDEGPPRLAPRLRPLHVGPKSNTNTPLCVFHDGSGLVTMYSKIQNADRDIYGFTDPYLLEDDGGFKSLEDMAAAYCSQIVEANIRRVILGGKCSCFLHAPLSKPG